MLKGAKKNTLNIRYQNNNDITHRDLVLSALQVLLLNQDTVLKINFFVDSNNINYVHL